MIYSLCHSEVKILYVYSYDAIYSAAQRTVLSPIARASCTHHVSVFLFSTYTKYVRTRYQVVSVYFSGQKKQTPTRNT